MDCAIKHSAKTVCCTASAPATAVRTAGPRAVDKIGEVAVNELSVPLAKQIRNAGWAEPNIALGQEHDCDGLGELVCKQLCLLLLTHGLEHCVLGGAHHACAHSNSGRQSKQWKRGGPPLWRAW
jgi:hypothetical protein